MNWLKKRISKLETSITGQPLGRGSFVYRIAKEVDPEFDGRDAREGVSLMMQRLRESHEPETGKLNKVT